MCVCVGRGRYEENHKPPNNRIMYQPDGNQKNLTAARGLLIETKLQQKISLPRASRSNLLSTDTNHSAPLLHKMAAGRGFLRDDIYHKNTITNF